MTFYLIFNKCNETNDQMKIYISNVLNNYILVDNHDKAKNDRLNRFLATKVYQNCDKIVNF